jgi:hypothetical protein
VRWKTLAADGQRGMLSELVLSQEAI